MKKQTAVEWLVETLNKSIGLTKFVDTCDEEYKQGILGIIEQAKAMEKEQIINAVYYTCSAMSHSDLSCGEEYYQKKFKSE